MKRIIYSSSGKGIIGSKSNKLDEDTMNILHDPQFSDIDVNKFIEKGYRGWNLRMACILLQEDGFDASEYIDPDEYSDVSGLMQSLAMLYGGKDFAKILPYLKDKRFDSNQLSIIASGIYEGLDYSIFADPSYSYYQMAMIKQALQLGEDYTEFLDNNPDVRKPTRKTSWVKFKEKLEDDLEHCDDPLYEQTGSGSALQDMMVDVENKLGLYLEPSIQLGMGGIWIYRGDQVIAEDVDYKSFNQSAIDLALSANNKSEFKKLYKNMLESYI